MIVVGGQAPKAIRSVECYDFEEDRWDQIAELPSRRCRAGEPQHLPACRLPFPDLPLSAWWQKSCSAPCFPKHLCIIDFLPFPSPLAQFLAVPSGVSSFVLRDVKLKFVCLNETKSEKQIRKEIR